MADNTPQNGVANVAGDEVTHSGDTAQVQIVQLGYVTGSEGAKTLAKLTGDTTYGLDVDAVRQAPPNVKIIKTSITRQADAVAYAVGDCFSNSSSAPTAGGGTITDAARVNGGSGTITGVVVSYSNSTPISFIGELWVFDQTPTAINDNAAFSLSDGDALNVIAIIPFYTGSTTALNSLAGVAIEEDFVCAAGSANLRYLVKILSAFTPAAGDVLGIVWKIRN